VVFSATCQAATVTETTTETTAETASSSDAFYSFTGVSGEPTLSKDVQLVDIYEIEFWILIVLVLWFVIWIFIKIYDYLI
jgi:hypothetical protein